VRELRRQSPESAFVFTTERGGPFTPDAVNRLIKRIGERARFAFPIHVHMLRHACDYALANAGHDTRAIQDWWPIGRSSTHDALHAIGAVQGLQEMMTGGLRADSEFCCKSGTPAVSGADYFAWGDFVSDWVRVFPAAALTPHSAQ
jgi:hypothetical protein